MKIAKKDIHYFSRQMCTLLDAGIPLVRSLEIVKNATENSRLQALILSLKTDIESGHAFSEALAKHPNYFDSLYLSLVSTGEASGKIEIMLSKIAAFKERNEKLHKKIKKAMIYPCVVTVMGIVITVLLLLYIVPQFEKLYANFAVALPVFTQIILNIAKFLQKFGLISLALLGGITWILLKAKKRSPLFSQQIDKSILKFPLLGPIVQKAILGRFSSTFATTFSAGVPLIDCLALVAKACDNQLYTCALLEVKQQVTKGVSLYNAMQKSDLFPPLLLQMIAVGEGSGSLAKILDKTAEFFEAEVDMAADSLSQLLEPLLMTLLGLLVGSLVIAMYLPLFKMGTIL